MKNEERRTEDAEVAGLEMDVGALFAASSDEPNDVQLSRMAARAASVSAEGGRMWRMATLGLTGAGVLALTLVLTNGDNDPSTDAPNEANVAVLAAEKEPAAVKKDPLVPIQPASGHTLRLPAELDEVRTEDEAGRVEVAMGTYLDMGLDGDGLGFDDWEAEGDGLSEDAMLRFMDDLVKRGG
jgi:hypothetical protein